MQRILTEAADPRKILKTGPGHGTEDDPLPHLEAELSHYREAIIPGLSLPPLTGGAIGYVGFDCVRYFEPRTARDMQDVLKVPESLFMLFDTIIAFDHFFQTVKIITYLHIPPTQPSTLATSPDITLATAYTAASAVIRTTIQTLQSTSITLPYQPQLNPNQPYESNIGEEGYKKHVKTLKGEIQRGSIIQAVPSHRMAIPTNLNPFNIYRELRSTNPSPYLFYISCGNFSIVGASPELLIKKEPDTGRIITHPIAGTVKRGTTPAEDQALADELSASLKDRAEHVMLVDLARNDMNRVCEPTSTRVDHLMRVQRFSHVQHLVSQVSGILRPDKTRFDAFRSIFPAGTVSGAPKVRAMELIAELEREKRGVYAGAVGYFGFNKIGVGAPGDGVEDVTTGHKNGTIITEEEGVMDTCIALRTMVVKDHTAYVQVGGGIVWDSVPEHEWIETMNKAAANIKCIRVAEERYSGIEHEVKMEQDKKLKEAEEKGGHVHLAAG